MKSKTIILMVVAVVCGLAASYMTSRLLAERGNDQPAEEEKVKVLVARQNIQAGTFIREPEKLFVEKDFIKGQEPRKAAKSFDEIKDRSLARPVAAEQWVSVDDLLRKDQMGLQVPKGMRAMAIKVQIDTLVAGFVLPSAKVDVVNTVRKDDKDSYSQILLQDMLVLAVGSIDVRDGDKKHIVDSTVTLAVTPEEALKLTLAQTLGELRLILRQPGDDAKVMAKAVKPEDVRRNNQGNKDSNSGGSEDDPAGGGKSLALVPDLPRPQSPGGGPDTPVPAPKRRKAHALTIFNGDSVTRAVFIDKDDEDDEPETQIQKSQPDREPARPTAAPDKQPTPAPTPDQGQPAKGQPGTGTRPTPPQRGTK